MMTVVDKAWFLKGIILPTMTRKAERCPDVYDWPWLQVTVEFVRVFLRPPPQQ
jgi:hypothetical protein